MPRGIAQITIRDENDISVGVTAPLKPIKEQLWLDTTTNPSILKRYNGSDWDIVNDYSEELEDIVEEIQTNTTAINVAQGQISTLISDTATTKGQVSTLNTNYSGLSQTVNGINATVGSHTTSIANVNTLADSKAKTFVATPTVPYKIGDIWLQGTSGDVMKCKTTKLTGSYTVSDWEKASKYTDDTKANTVEGNLNSTITRVSTVESGITQLNNQIKLKVESSDITTAINNIQVGGRNFVLNSKNLIFNATGNKSIKYNLSNDFIKNIRGKYVVFSAYVEGNFTEDGNCHFAVDGRICYKDGTDSWIGVTRDVMPTIKNTDGSKTVVGKRYEEIFLIEDKEIDYIDSLDIFIREAISVKNFTIKDIKAEIGNKATTYTEAPEDVTNAISTVDGRITVTSNNVSALDISLGKIATRVGSVESSVTTNTANIGGLTNRVNSTESSITQLNDSMSLKVTSDDVTTAISNIEVGGRNLLSMKDVSGYETADFTRNGYSVTAQVNHAWGGIEFFNLRDVMELNREHIFQCQIKKIFGTLTNILLYQDNQYEIHEILIDGVKRNVWDNADMGIDNNLWHTFTIRLTRTIDIEGDGSGDVNVLLIQPNRSFATPVGIEVKNIKLEKGNKATDWTPSVEDVDGSINTAITGMEIGGRNLVLNSKENYLETTTNKSIPFELSDDFSSLVRGQYVTLSAFIEGECATDDYCYYGVDVCIHFTDGTEEWIGLNTGNFEEVLNEDGSKSIIGQRYSNLQLVPDKEVARLSSVVLFIRDSTSLISFTIKDVKIEIGKVATAWTPAIEDIDNAISDVYDYIATVSEEQVSHFQASLELTAESITQNVSETYATKDDTTSEIERLSTTLTESSTDFNFKIASEREYAEKVDGALQSFKNTVETNINFDASGMSISASNSPFASKFTTTKLSFTQDDNEVAYISNNKMYNTDVEIKNSLVIGSVVFLPRQNGNLSIVWKEG